MKPCISLLLLAALSQTIWARDYHVSPAGNNAHDGSAAKPYQTISAAAQVAQPGDTIIVHAGVYRERVTPPRGGKSDAKRIVHLVDNNLLLSDVSMKDRSEGGAFVHNLIAGRILSQPEPNRSTPYHKAHSTQLAGLCTIEGGDNRFYNNIMVDTKSPTATPTTDARIPYRLDFGLRVYDAKNLSLQTGGNVYLNGARPCTQEVNPLVLVDFDPELHLVEERDQVFLHLNLSRDLRQAATMRVTTELLGKAKIPNLPYETPDCSALIVDTDYFGEKRNSVTPSAGPFEHPGPGQIKLKVW